MKQFLAKLDWSYFYAFLGEATLALTLVFYIILARVLGPEEYGLFAAATALAAILALFIQLGMPGLLTREVAANPSQAPQLTVQCLVLELMGAIGILLVLYPLATVLGYQDRAILICYLAVFAEIGRAALMTLRSVAKGEGWFRTESVVLAIERTVVMALACWVLFRTGSLVLVMATIVIVRILDVIGFFYYLHRRLGLLSTISRPGLYRLTKAAYPFAVSGVLWVIYYQIDLVMLKTLSTEAETGFYSASYRILEIFNALPRVIFYVLFTRFARYNVTQPEKLPEQLYKGSRLLLGAVLPMVLIAGFIQEFLISRLYGDAFSRSMISLSILLPSLSIKIFSHFANQFTQAVKHEKLVPGILLATALFNIVINAILIPQFGALGAAIATLTSELMLTTLALRNLKKIGYGTISFKLGWLTVLSFVAVAIPSLILMGMGVFWGIAVIGVSCLAILYIMRPRFFLQQI
jgi:O-antigen/teichoic acid export membrane protein